MKVFFYIVLALVVTCLYYAYMMYRKVHISKQLVSVAHAFQIPSTDYTTSILVLGDSTAVGVGATNAQDSMAGLIAKKVSATYLENQGVSGAEVRDLPSQIAKIHQKEYSYIVIQIGGNDIVARHNPQEEADRLAIVIAQLPKTQHLIVMSCGDVGTATLFPWFVRPYFTSLTLKYHNTFTKAVTEHGGTYINLYNAPDTDPFILHPDIYLASDEFHPSSAGYKNWFEKVVAVL